MGSELLSDVTASVVPVIEANEDAPFQLLAATSHALLPNPTTIMAAKENEDEMIHIAITCMLQFSPLRQLCDAH